MENKDEGVKVASDIEIAADDVHELEKKRKNIDENSESLTKEIYESDYHSMAGQNEKQQITKQEHAK